MLYRSLKRKQKTKIKMYDLKKINVRLFFKCTVSKEFYTVKYLNVKSNPLLIEEVTNNLTLLLPAK